MYPNVLNSTIYNSQDMEAVCVHWQANGEDVACVHNGRQQ